ncbi:MAG: peptidase M14 [Gemmatimonadales bacterium]|nr:peptidase M14 [Gemmatimonadales bacterium]
MGRGLLLKTASRAALALAVIAAAACAGRPAPGAPLPQGADPGAMMRRGLEIAGTYRVAAITERRFTHAEFWQAVEQPLASNVFRVEDVGRSIQGRSLRTVSYGNGPVRVLLWSQMHGDEATATMALADIFRFLAEATDDPLRERLRQQLTIVFLPMLNPDGAELFQRENALGVDVNRDARRLVTPEARALKGVHDRFQPRFGFNLHDQSARTRVGTNGEQAAMALLAPAYDAARGYNAVRSDARHVAATIVQMLASEIPGRVARYDDTFNPRAFGDLMQTWGTSTVLIESGALPGDPQKQRLRAINVAAILGALDAIATNRFAAAGATPYEALAFNSGGISDLLVVGAQVVLPGRSPMLADIAINYDDPVARTGARIREVGDLQAVQAIDTIDVAGLFLHQARQALVNRGTASWLTIGSSAALDVRRGPDPGSALVRQIGDSAR